jgi:lipid II:glycine glycyltransferase (peptidoglycan interpeptide bridge formation enzyme)
MNKKDIYRNFSKKEKSLNFFSRAEWLDTVAGNEWDVSLVINDAGEVVASMPYILKKFFFFKIIVMPQLTPKLGPWIKNYILNSSSKNNKYLEILIDQLPRFSFFNQNWDYAYKFWLPFYWRGYDQTTYYSYVLNDLTNLELLYNNFSSACKRQIKKAIKNKVNVIESNDLKRFIALQDKTFFRQKRISTIKDNYFFELDSYLNKKGKRKIFIAQDKLGNDLAAVYLVWDENCSYYLAGGGDSKFRNSGAGNLCMWHAIKFASSVSKIFDFEGSMIKNINKYFSTFGAVQKEYFSVRKSNSIFISLLFYIKTKIKSKFIIS